MCSVGSTPEPGLGTTELNHFEDLSGCIAMHWQPPTTLAIKKKHVKNTLIIVTV